MNTPMETKLKLMVDTSSKLVDYVVQKDHWIVDVSNEHQVIYMFCCEHLESISGRTQTCSPSCCKTCDEIP
jgi:hypothetical protein